MSRVVKEFEIKDKFWETQYQKEIPKITCRKIIKDKGWVLSNVFTPSECKKFIDFGNKIGYGSLKGEYHPSYRNNTRFMLSSASLAEEMYKRISEYIPDVLYEKWQKDGLNDYFRFCKYEKHGIFAIHQDGSYKPSLNYQSLLTCMLYLNRVDGGNTRFFEDNKKKIIVELPPQPGQVLLFDPDIWHDGSKVLSGEKYIIRTEVMYQKI